jgi:hypothetical protein
MADLDQDTHVNTQTMTEEEVTKLVDAAYNAMISAINVRCKTSEQQSRALLEELAPYSNDDGFFDFDRFKKAVLEEHGKNLAAVATFEPKNVAVAVDKKVREKLPQVRVATSLRERLANERMTPADKFFHDVADRLEDVIEDALRHPEKMQTEKVSIKTHRDQWSYDLRYLSFKHPSLATLTRQDAWETSGFTRLAKICASPRVNMGLGDFLRPYEGTVSLSEKFGRELRIYPDLAYETSKYSVTRYETNESAKVTGRYWGEFRYRREQNVCGLKEKLQAEKRDKTSQYLSDLADVIEERIIKAEKTPGGIKELAGKRAIVFEDQSLNFISGDEALVTPGGSKLKETCLDLDMKLEVEQTEGEFGKVRVFIDVPYPDGAAIKAERAQQAALEAEKEAKLNNPGFMRRVFSSSARQRHAATKAAIAAQPAVKVLSF